MNKEQKISMRIKELEKEKVELENLIREKNKLISEQVELYRELYQDFYLSKNSKDFVLYDRFPKSMVVRSYYSKLPLSSHPIMEYGMFDIKELAEIVKLLYSFQRQKEYQIVSFGKLECDGILRIDPNMYFLIGDDKILENYSSYQQCFFEQEKKFYHDRFPQSDFTYLKADRIIDNLSCYPYDDMLKISCHIPSIIVPGSFKLDTEINYYDYLRKMYLTASFKKDINIFKNSEYLSSELYHYKGIKDILTMPLFMNDTFVAKALISIAIYKKNHQKTSLSNEDYRYIFHEMFQEDVDIEKEVDKDIPKQLKYVPR